MNLAETTTMLTSIGKDHKWLEGKIGFPMETVFKLENAPKNMERLIKQIVSDAKTVVDATTTIPIKKAITRKGNKIAMNPTARKAINNAAKTLGWTDDSFHMFTGINLHTCAYNHYMHITRARQILYMMELTPSMLGGGFQERAEEITAYPAEFGRGSNGSVRKYGEALQRVGKLNEFTKATGIPANMLLGDAIMSLELYSFIATKATTILGYEPAEKKRELPSKHSNPANVSMRKPGIQRFSKNDEVAKLPDKQPCNHAPAKKPTKTSGLGNLPKGIVQAMDKLSAEEIDELIAYLQTRKKMI